jgi:hypothetical protein
MSSGHMPNAAQVPAGLVAPGRPKAGQAASRPRQALLRVGRPKDRTVVGRPVPKVNARLPSQALVSCRRTNG